MQEQVFEAIEIVDRINSLAHGCAGNTEPSLAELNEQASGFEQAAFRSAFRSALCEAFLDDRLV